MTVCTLTFVFGALLVATFFFQLPIVLRRAVFTGGSALFLSQLVPNPSSWLALGLFLLSGWVMARLLARRPRRALLATYMAALLGAFVILKKYAFMRYVLPERVLAHPVGIVGLSFMLFRQIHFVVDAIEGQIEPAPSLWSYLNYQLNLFTLLSGPIQRFEDFRAWWREPQPLHRDRHELLKAVLRVLNGVLLIEVVAGACQWLTDYALSGFSLAGPRGYLRLPVIFYFFPAYVFFNFAGYCEIVIGGASLFGLKLPENFNRPYLARNMIDYWTRWHISLSNWIRDYLFTPLFTALVRKRPGGAQAFAIVCYFVALFLAGVWHGATLNFVVFGLLNGVGVAAAKLWETRILRRGGRPALRAYMQSRRNRIVATFANIHFACFTMMFFASDLALAALAHMRSR